MNEQILTVVLEEYKTLRSEVINAVDRQYSLTNWSISGVALLVAALATSWHNLHNFPGIAVAMVVLAVPAIVTLYVVAWSHVIAKINLLGWYIYHIENKLASLFSLDEIRLAYGLPSETPVQPFLYLMGWEHRLWQQHGQPLVRRTIHLVQIALAGVYVVIIGAGIYVGALTYQIPFRLVAFHPVIVFVAASWIIVWIILARYLGGITNVDSAPVLRPTTQSNDLPKPSV